MATVRFILCQEERKVYEGRYPVLLQVSDRGKKWRHVTGFYANPQEWEQRDTENKYLGRYRQGSGTKKFLVPFKSTEGMKEVDNKSANSLLSAMEAEISEVIRQLDKEKKDWSLEQLRTVVKVKKAAKSFSAFAEDVVAGYKQKGKYQRASITEDALRTFRDFDPHFDKRTFGEIDKDYILAYIDFFKNGGTNHSGKEHKANRAGAISIRLREIRRILNLAIRSKVVSMDNYPFGKEGVKMPTPDKDDKARNRRKFVPSEGLTKLAHTDFENYHCELAKRLFLFSFHCRGLNFRDMAELTEANIHEVTTTTGKVMNAISYQRSKTGKRIEVFITKNVQDQLDWFKANTPLIGDYLLPIILKEPSPEQRDEYIRQRRKRVNAKLKVIANKLGFPESQTVSFYGARHSFAMFLFSQGKPMELISAAMDHEKMETTQDYIKGFTSEQIATQADTTL